MCLKTSNLTRPGQINHSFLNRKYEQVSVCMSESFKRSRERSAVLYYQSVWVLSPVTQCYWKSSVGHYRLGSCTELQHWYSVGVRLSPGWWRLQGLWAGPKGTALTLCLWQEPNYKEYSNPYARTAPAATWRLEHTKGPVRSIKQR